MRLNELISNSLKYAFQEKDSGQIDVQIAQLEEGLQVIVSDNGQGLPPNFQPEQSNSLGFKLIRSFANKMKAKLDVFSKEGTQVSLLLPPVQAVWQPINSNLSSNQRFVEELLKQEWIPFEYS